MCVSSVYLPHSTRAAAFTLVCLTVLVASSCREFFDDSTKTKPDTGTLLGTWVPDKESLKHMREAGGYDISNKTELVLEVNGTYKMNNIPDWLWLDDGLSQKTLRSESGTWEVTRDADRPDWIVHLKTQMNARSAALLGQHPPYTLRFSFGNIDSNPQSMTFFKEK